MVLVTGGTGFIGSHLIDGLLERGQAVRVLARKSSRIPVRFRNNVEWVHGDILDIISLQEAMHGVDKIYHCAAMVSFEAHDHKVMHHVNVQGTANVVNLALQGGVKKLLHVSSVAAIGRTGKEEIITERNQWENSSLNSAYALSKYLAEREAWRGTQEGLATVIVNPSMVVGPCEDWKQGTGRFFYTSRNGLRFYPKGVNGFVYVKDVVNCMIQLMDSDIAGERFIISSENYSYKNFITEITKELGVKQPSIKVYPWITEIIWRVSAALNTIFGVYPLLTKETARNANHAYYYTSDKVIKTLGVRFLSIGDTVKLTAEKFRKDLTAAR